MSLTADALPNQVQAALDAGADLHLAKPVVGSTLFATIAQALAIGANASDDDGRRSRNVA